jgi:NAD(P)-dependent dehydrogenase (short-subunit alcohol dehydrogenase family)
MDSAALEQAVAEAAKGGADSGGAAHLNGLVYAVGSIPLKPLKSTSAKDFLDAYTLNFLGGALALKAAAPALSAGATAAAAAAAGSPAAAASPSAFPTSSAVFFSTVAAQVGFPNHCAIAAAKGAVDAFVRSAAAELCGQRIRVNAIAPSLSDTPLASRMLSSDAMKKALGDAHPIARVGTAEDSAALADFLLDGAVSGWITGQVWGVDGGRAALRPKN